MTLSDLSSIATVISGIAVLASLVYLALQIRQNTKHSQALIQQGRAARISETALRLAELADSKEMERCFEGSADVSANDVRRFMFLCRAVFVSAEDSYLQNKQGLLDPAAFESFEYSVRSGMGSGGVAVGWKMTRDMYEPGFRAYMDSLLGDVAGPAVVQDRGVARWQQIVAASSGKA